MNYKSDVEAIDAFVEKYFTGTPSRIGGIGIERVEEDVVRRHASAFSPSVGDLPSLESGGILHFRHNSETHLFSPEAITLLQRATRENDYSVFKEYSGSINDVSKIRCTSSHYNILNS